MATQKKYHDLVILDRENTEARQTKAKKLVSGILFFIIGVFIGALLISVLNNENTGLTQVSPITIHSSPSNDSDIAPITTELQSITSITPSSEKSGCGIESLGRNSLEGCSSDAFTETPLDATKTNAAEVSDINSLDDTPKDIPSDNDSTLDSGVTNILDLQ